MAKTSAQATVQTGRIERSRNLASFGVAGSLASSAKVFYENVFSSRHLGRVSDLLVARLRDSGVDELMLRTLLLHGVFEACQAIPGGTQPILLECGLDESHFAVGISFDRGMGEEPDFQALVRQAGSERSEAMVFDAGDRLVDWIRHWSQLGSEVIVRGQSARGKIEVVVTVPLGATTSGPSQAPARIQPVWIEAEPEVAPEIESYTELGDLDYKTLLASDSPRKVIIASATGEFPIKLFQITADVGVFEGVTRIKGDGSLDSAVAGTEVIRVKGSSANDDPAELSSSHPLVRRYVEKIDELQIRIKKMEEKAAGLESQSAPTEDATSVSRIQKIIRKVWPFRGRPVQLINPKGIDSKAAVLAIVPASFAGTSEEELAVVPDATRGVVDSLLDEIETGGLTQTISRFGKESDKVKAEIGNTKAQRLLDGMMAELVSEKTRLNEMAKQITLGIRQKETLFKNKEAAYQADLQARDRAVRHKEASMNRLKEMLAQSNLAVERLKAQTQGASAVVSKAKTGATPTEVSALKLNLERAIRQVEEFKKSNQQLSERLAETHKSRDSNTASVGELKTRLDASMKMLTLGKKQSERLTAQVDALRRDEARLKSQLAKALSDLTVLQAKAVTKSSNAA